MKAFQNCPNCTEPWWEPLHKTGPCCTRQRNLCRSKSISWLLHTRHYVMSSLQLLSAMVHDNAVIRTVLSWSNLTPPRPLGFWTLNPLPLTPLLPISDSECYDYDLDCLANVARDFGVPVPRGGRSLAGFGKLDLLKQATPSASHIPSLSNPFPPFP